MEQAIINRIRNLAGERIKTGNTEEDTRVTNAEIEEIYNYNNQDEIETAIYIWNMKKAEALDEKEVESEDISGIKTKFMSATDFVKICDDNIVSLKQQKFEEQPEIFEFA